MLYFTYGSNMWLKRIEDRLGPCRSLGPAWVDGYRLAFHKSGGDGSGKCDGFFTGNTEERLYGVVYELTQHQRGTLDGLEGDGYGSKDIVVHTAKGDLNVYTYVALADAIMTGLQPFDWYKSLVLVGARKAALPESYVGQIDAMCARRDGNLERATTYFELLARA